MKHITAEQFLDGLDEKQLEVLGLVNFGPEKMDHGQLMKLLQRQCETIHQMVFGVMPSPHGHFHYGVKLKLKIKDRVPNDVLKFMIIQEINRQAGRPLVEFQVLPYSIIIEGVTIYDNCDEYNYHTGLDRLLLNYQNSPAYVDN